MPRSGITPRSGVGASEACAPGAERESFALLGLSRDCWKFGIPLLSLASATEYTGIVTFTSLIFHAPAAKRARRRAKLARPRRSRGSAAFGGAPGAERESFSPHNSQHHRQKSPSYKFPQPNLYRHCKKPHPLSNQP
jgi:hypothetical protein